MQVYGNSIHDLLAGQPGSLPQRQQSEKSSGGASSQQSSQKSSLQIREIVKGNEKHLFISGLSEFRVACAEDVLRLLRLGNSHRSVRSTEYNEHSSRSHAILQLSLEVESRGVAGATIIRRAKVSNQRHLWRLHCVDRDNRKEGHLRYKETMEGDVNEREQLEPERRLSSPPPTFVGSANRLFISSQLNLVDLAGSEKVRSECFGNLRSRWFASTSANSQSHVWAVEY